MTVLVALMCETSCFDAYQAGNDLLVPGSTLAEDSVLGHACRNG
jgi:hypothetical protein